MIINIDKERFIRDFLPMIGDLEMGKAFDQQNPQHIAYLHKKIDASYTGFGQVLAEYSDDGKAVGYIWFEHDTGIDGIVYMGKVANIRQIGVFEQFRRGGSGKKLLKSACAHVKTKGGECIYTDTYANDNCDALTFYIKTGFIPVALLPGMNGITDFGQVYLYKIL